MGPYFLKWQADVGHAAFHEEKLKVKRNSLNLGFHMEIIKLTFHELPHQQVIFINICIFFSSGVSFLHYYLFAMIVHC